MGTSYNPKIVTNGLILHLDAANVKSYPAGQDTFVNNVSLMLDGESLTDKSQNAVTVTVQGAVTVNSSVKKVGNSSLKFSGALTDYLTVPSSSLFAFPGDFTIEFWTYANQWAQIGGATVYFCNGVLDQFQIGVYPNNSNIQLYINGSVIQGALSASIVGRWMHIAVVRSGSTITIYEDGVSRASGTSSYSVPASICYIGRQLPRSPIDYGANLDGYIDDFRITKGARYTSNFTPPTAPLSLPGIVTDLTKNRSIGTLINGPTYSGGNIVLDGTNDYITIPASAAIDVSTNTTFEIWIKPSSTISNTGQSNADVAFIRKQTSGAGFILEVFGTTGSNKTLAFWVNYPSGASVTYTLNANTWYQIVGTYNGSVCNLYVNGNLVATSSFSSSGQATNTAVHIGYFQNSRYFNGSVSISRIYNKSLTLNEIRQNFNATKGRFGL